jgi:hypothetical protein
MSTIFLGGLWNVCPELAFKARTKDHRARQRCSTGRLIVVALNGVSDYVVLILVSAGTGALGGFAAALVPTQSPGVNNPRWLTGAIVGAAAAVAILIVLPGTTTTTSVVLGKTTSTTTWSLVKVIPVAIIAGWAGPKVLGAVQDRLLAATKNAQLNATVTVAKSELVNIARTANTAVPQGITPAAAADAAPAMKSALEDAVQDGKTAIDAAAGKVPG